MKIKVVYVKINHMKLQKGSIVSWRSAVDVQPTASENLSPFGTTGLFEANSSMLKGLSEGIYIVDVATKSLVLGTDNNRRRGHLDFIIKDKQSNQSEIDTAQTEFDTIKDLV